MIMTTLLICIVFLVAFRISVIFSRSRKRIHTEIATLTGTQFSAAHVLFITNARPTTHHFSFAKKKKKTPVIRSLVLSWLAGLLTMHFMSIRIALSTSVRMICNLAVCQIGALISYKCVKGHPTILYYLGFQSFDEGYFRNVSKFDIYVFIFFTF